MGLECSLCNVYRLAVEAARPRHGVKPGFEPWHVIGFLLLASRGPIGRPLASRVLGIGDTAAKTMLRRLHEMGVIVKRGVAGSELSPSTRTLLDALGVCVQDECIGVQCAPVGFCEGLGYVLKLRDALVSLGSEPLLIMCCGNGVEAPGAPREYVAAYSSKCSGCINSSRVCVVYPNRIDPIVDAARLVYSLGAVVCD